ncbi:MAG: glycosyltransferase [Gemmatimonadetes bacterium]|nr:glycosyltransferase [Gemmatimonadota bacterium]
MRKKSVLYYFDKSLVEPIPRLHGTRQMELLASQREIVVVSTEPGARSAAEQETFDATVASLAEHGVRHEPITRGGGRLAQIARASLVLFRHVRAGRGDILHCRSYMPSVAGWLVSAVTRARFVFDMRGLFVDEYVFEGALEEGTLRYRFARLLERRLLRAAGAIVVVSERFRDHLLTRPDLSGFMGGKRIFVIPNRTEVDSFTGNERESIRAELGWSDATIGIYSGSTAEWHRVDRTIEAAARLARLEPEARFLFLVYPEREKAMAMAEAAGLGPERARFLTLAPAEVPAHLGAADFAFMLIEPHISKQVCAPIKFAEYLAAGLPVVAGGGLGDTEEWIRSGKLGVLVEQRDPDGVAEATSDMLSSDDFRRGLMKERCRTFAKERLDMALTTREYEAVYEEIDRA